MDSLWMANSREGEERNSSHTSGECVSCMWKMGVYCGGNLVVIPPKRRAGVLQMFHEAHPGIAHMKGFARGYVWWHNIDIEMESV